MGILQLPAVQTPGKKSCNICKSIKKEFLLETHTSNYKEKISISLYCKLTEMC